MLLKLKHHDCITKYFDFVKTKEYELFKNVGAYLEHEQILIGNYQNKMELSKIYVQT